MNNMTGIILTVGKYPMLKELAQYRCTSALPVASKYRAIDFVLSNMVNSGITNIDIIVQDNAQSLIQYIDTGKEWDLHKKNSKFRILTPHMNNVGPGWYRGSADALHQNLSFIKDSKQEHVLICFGNCIYKIQYDRMLKYHIHKKADITIAYKSMHTIDTQELSNLGTLQVGADEKITDYQQNSFRPIHSNVSAGIYIIRKELLIQSLEKCIRHKNFDFVKDVMVKMISESNVFGYKLHGYWQCLNSINTYYKCNMAFLNPLIQYELLSKNSWLCTKDMDEAPAKYYKEAEVHNSLIANNCIVKGKVENSIIFGGTKIERGAIVKNSIIMHDSVISQDTFVSNVILDNEVTLSKGKYIKGEINLPILIESKVSA